MPVSDESRGEGVTYRGVEKGGNGIQREREREREGEGWFPAAHPFASPRVFFPVVSRRIESRWKLISCLCGSTSLPPRHTSGNVTRWQGAGRARGSKISDTIEIRPSEK